MTGEQTASEELGKACSSARPQSSPLSDLGHYLLGTADMEAWVWKGAGAGFGGSCEPKAQDRDRKEYRAGGRGKEKYTLTPQDGAFEFIALEVEKQHGNSISKGPTGVRVTKGLEV